MAQVAATGTSDLSALDPARDQGRRRALRAHEPGPRRQARPPRRGRQGLGGHDRRARRGADRGPIGGRARLGARPRADRAARDRGAGRRGREHRLGRSAAAIQRSRSPSGRSSATSISEPPTCGHDARSNDLVTLGKLLREHGFAVGENAEMGDDPAPGVHAANGYHYKCRALRRARRQRRQGPAPRSSAIDGIVGQLQKLGFRTIWQAAGHFDHIHIDVANSGAIGVGFGDGGAVGALEETRLDVKLIDWDAEYRRSAASVAWRPAASTAGRPTCRSRAIICDVLDRYATAAPARACGCRRSRPRSSSPACTTSPTATATRSASSSSARGRGPGAPRSEIMNPVHAARHLRARGDRPPELARSATAAPASSRRPSRAPASRCATTRCRCRRTALMNKACGS